MKICKDIYFRIVIAVEEAGYSTVATVCDMGGQNPLLWRQLGLGIVCTLCENRVDESREIFFFADAPHLLKLLRNHMINQGLKVSFANAIPQELDVSKKTFQVDNDIFLSLLRLDGRELKLCHKISMEHFDISDLKSKG